MKTKRISSLLCLYGLLFASVASAQNINDVRWKSEAQVKAVLGEPISITPPVGTHASYTLWKYDNFTVAFANNKAFHLFDKNSLKQVKLNEERVN